MEAEYPYPADDDDHCETQIEAYRDVAPILEILANEMNKAPESVRIYDPFYCEGAVVARLGVLGFKNVYNRKEDFYTVQKPEHDIIVTNPPYSSDHMDKLFDYLFNQTKPWFVLVPNYVYMKEYFKKQLAEHPFIASCMLYVCPNKRYTYTTPKGRRQKKSAKYTSPFPSFWYSNMYRYTDKVLTLYTKQVSAVSATSDVKLTRIIRSLTSLPLDLSTGEDSRKKRARNADKRKKNKMRKRQKLELPTP